MRTKLILPLLVLMGFTGSAQTTTTYFSNEEMTIETVEKNARYAQQKTISGDSLIEETYDLKKDQILSYTVYVENSPTGIWKFRQGKKDLELNMDDLSYTPITNMDSIGVMNPKDSACWNCTMAEFQGSMSKFMVDNFTYPQYAKNNGITGKTYITFLVNAEGEVSPLYIAKSSHPILDAVSWELVKKMPNWKPGTKDGESVSVTFTLPISYRLGGR